VLVVAVSSCNGFELVLQAWTVRYRAMNNANRCASGMGPSRSLGKNVAMTRRLSLRVRIAGDNDDSTAGIMATPV